MITADQLVAHAIGDYVLQSDWMANENAKKSLAALIHAGSYALPFFLFRPSLAALAVILWTHFFIDRFRLARFVVYAKNFLSPRSSREVTYEEVATTAGGVPYFSEHVKVSQWWFPWADCKATGYPSARPPWMSVWLLIIADNVMHVLINGAALKWL